MSTEYQAITKDQYLLLHIELKKGIEKSRSLTATVQETIIRTLRAVNSEYDKLYTSIGPEKSKPEVRLCSYEEGDAFQKGIKHRWAQN